MGLGTAAIGGTDTSGIATGGGLTGVLPEGITPTEGCTGAADGTLTTGGVEFGGSGNLTTGGMTAGGMVGVDDTGGTLGAIGITLGLGFSSRTTP